MLGIIDPGEYTKGKYIMITRLLYLARKLIASYWMAPGAPTGKQWIAYVNSLLGREHLAYKRRKAVGKFEEIWHSWLGDASVAPPKLVMDRFSM